jgi:TM2 domain-containing membrane protein YozV
MAEEERTNPTSGPEPATPPAPLRPTKFCHACGATIDQQAEICPKCGVRQPATAGGQAGSSAALADTASKRLVAGICGILLGGLGVHKFILGMVRPAVIMLVVTIAGWPLFFIGPFVMWVIGIIEGIIYLTKNDHEFHEQYVVGKKEWF